MMSRELIDNMRRALIDMLSRALFEVLSRELFDKLSSTSTLKHGHVAITYMTAIYIA